MCLMGKVVNKPIFVVGSGRSGTHWLAYSLSSHPQIFATIEKQPMFDLSTRIALHPQLESRLYERLAWLYRIMLLRAAPRHYLDKSHPNIWIAERLHATFPNAQFIGIERNPYATVASMIKHKAVSSRHKRWVEFPMPNRFLGITEQTVKTYQQMPMVARCALSWLAHHDQMNAIQSKLGDALTVISYEVFAHDTAGVIKKLRQFLGLQHTIALPPVERTALKKWKTQLSNEDIRQIHAIVGNPPEAYRYY